MVATEPASDLASTDDERRKRERFIRFCVSAGLFLLAYLIITALQVWLKIYPRGVSGAPHYVVQAMSLLQGHLDLRTSPRLWDTIEVHGKAYLAFPPVPALMLLPFVAIFGLKTSDVLFTSAISELSLPLLFLLFEQLRAIGLTRRSRWENATLAALLYFGSITLWMSLGGGVWFTEQIVAFFFTLLALIAAFRRRYGWSSALMGLAVLTRGTCVLGYPLLLYLAWQDIDREPLLRRFLRSLRSGRPDTTAIPFRRLGSVVLWAAAAVGVFLVRDMLIFGSPFESGYGIATQQNYPQITHGLYSLQYVWMNIVAAFIDFPRVTFSSPFDLHPQIDWLNGGMGISVFFTTPLFLFLFVRNQRRSPVRAAIWFVIALMMAQALLYCWTGYYQFGARYLFDAYPFAFVLLALNDVRIDWRVIALGLFAIAVNIAGAQAFWK